MGVGHIASQCPNKRTMITRVDGEVETESEGDDDQMPSFEDACDNDVEYLVEGELARRALSAQVKEDDMEAAMVALFFRSQRVHLHHRSGNALLHIGHSVWVLLGFVLWVMLFGS